MLRAEPPAGWRATEIPPPALGGGSGARLAQWAAHRSPDGDVLLVGCVSTPIPGWVEDMRGAVEARAFALTASSIEKIVGQDLTAHEEDGHVAHRTADGSVRAVSRTFVGWNGPAVVTCFATCVGPAARGCDRQVDEASLGGGTAPPPPGLALGLVTWAVHHPTQTVVGASVLVFFAGVIAVAARRRPRSRI